jgi:hypothetical protein
MVLLGLLLLAAPLTPEKLELAPALWPWERRAVAGAADHERALVDAGVSRAFVARLAALPDGPLLAERCAHAAVLAADLSPKQRALFARVVPATDDAQRALAAQRVRLLRDLAPDPVERARIEASFVAQQRELEKRFWRVVLYALDEEERARLKPELPEPFRNPPDLLFQVYRLPDLTPSQTNRIRALVAEYESESAADLAEIARLRREQGAALGEEAGTEARGTIARALQDATDRLARRLKRAIELSYTIYTPAQKWLSSPCPKT